VDSHLFAIHGPLDVAALDAAVRHVIAAHPALRARFELRDGRVVQRIAPAPAPAAVSADAA